MMRHVNWSGGLTVQQPIEPFLGLKCICALGFHDLSVSANEGNEGSPSNEVSNQKPE